MKTLCKLFGKKLEVGNVKGLVKDITLILNVVILVISIILLANISKLQQQQQQEIGCLRDIISSVEDILIQEKARISINRDLRDFTSLNELKQFLAEDKTNESEYIAEVFDCDDFARMLQKNALEQGYIVNTQMLFKQHMMNMAIAGDEIYYIEPTTDELLFVNYLDKR